jgi:hypothetical protein
LADGGSITWEHLEDLPILPSNESTQASESCHSIHHPDVSDIDSDRNHASQDNIEDIHDNSLTGLAFAEPSASSARASGSTLEDSLTPLEDLDMGDVSNISLIIPIIRVSMASPEPPASTSCHQQESATSVPSHLALVPNDVVTEETVSRRVQ